MTNFVRKRLVGWLSGLSEVNDFEIKPMVEGDNLRADGVVLRKSKVVRQKAKTIERQTKEKVG